MEEPTILPLEVGLLGNMAKLRSSRWIPLGKVITHQDIQYPQQFAHIVN